MSFASMFASPVAAIRSNSQAFQVIGDNISNAVTPGYKAADTRFIEVLSSNAATNFESLGGVRPSIQHFIGEQGLLQRTDNDLDIAINGQGFLISNTQFDEAGEYQLSRSGQTSLTVVQNGGNEEAYLTDPAGNFLLGWPADSSGNFAPTPDVSALDPIRVDRDSAVFDPVATTAASLSAILPAGAATGTVHSVGIPVIDAAGDAHSLTLQFTKNAAPRSWDVAASVSNGTVTGGGTTTLTFDATGAIVPPGAQSIGMSFTGTGGATTVAVDYANLSEFGGPFNVVGFTQNGIEQGTLESVSFDEDGVLSGQFSNGQSRPLYKLPLATVFNPNLLEIRNDSHFAVSQQSGEISLLEADQTGLGSFAPASLEQSTTDIASEFTKMIVTQQGYTTAVQAYTVVSEMVEVATQLKR